MRAQHALALCNVRIACGHNHLPASNWDTCILSTMQVWHHVLHCVHVSYIVVLASLADWL